MLGVIVAQDLDGVAVKMKPLVLQDIDWR